MARVIPGGGGGPHDCEAVNGRLLEDQSLDVYYYYKKPKGVDYNCKGPSTH